MSPDPKRAAELIADLELTSRCGKVNKVVGMVAEGSGLKAPLGSLCHILPGGRADLRAARADGLIPVEVVGFRDGNTLFARRAAGQFDPQFQSAAAVPGRPGAAGPGL